ncbi:uncharacterized protein LOC100901388 [Galendromus occidentalis]|uniref:Uncharacterized protein LOC100901388 n=1 Tax=Galendromus occidentalis TaxID=34638 RepID=A0AAJ6QQB7_9ACAR|nr:uncharacterized protein LOC100901388 [Galendromus occidentalis]
MAPKNNSVCWEKLLVVILCAMVTLAQEDTSKNQVATGENPKDAAPRNGFLDILAPFTNVAVIRDRFVGVRAPFTNVLVERKPDQGGLSKLLIDVPFFKMDLGGPDGLKIDVPFFNQIRRSAT